MKFGDKGWDSFGNQVRIDLSCNATNKQSSTQTKSTGVQNKMQQRTGKEHTWEDVLESQ